MSIIADIADIVYTGSQIKPEITLKNPNITTYTVTYGENINVGKGTVTITATAKDGSKKKATYKIWRKSKYR